LRNSSDRNLSTAKLFFMEYQTPFSGHFHILKSVLFKRNTRFQDILIAETFDLGRCLIIDGKIQSSTRDEYIYHEVLTHPILTAHPNPQNILIIGGGEGATAREALKHNPTEVDMVDIDVTVFRSVQKYIPQMCSGICENPNFSLIVSDGRKFLESTPRRYDAIIIDVTDPLPKSPSYLLYTKEFYSAVFKSLRKNGIMVTQATSTFYSKYFFLSVVKTLKEIFPIVRPFSAWVPSYGSLWGFVSASKLFDPKKLPPQTIIDRLKNRGVSDLKYYDHNVHKMLFELPRNLSSPINMGEGEIICDENPQYVPI